MFRLQKHSPPTAVHFLQSGMFKGSICGYDQLTCFAMPSVRPNSPFGFDVGI